MFRLLTTKLSHFKNHICSISNELFKSQNLGECKEHTSERSLLNFFNVSLDPLCIIGVDGFFKELNPAFEATLGFTINDLKASEIFHFIHPEDIESTKNEISKLKLGIITINFENRHRCKDDSYKTFIWSASLEPHTGMIYAAGRDITVKKEAERLLEEAQKVAKIGSWSFNPSNGQISWSKQMFQLFDENYHSGAPTFDRHYSTIHPDDQELWKTSVERCITFATPYRMRFRSVFPDKILWLDANGSATTDICGNIVLLSGTCQDITELVEAENQAKIERAKAIQSGKLASLGEMSAGLAHEINNPLAIIAGMAATIPAAFGDHDKLMHKVKSIEKSCQRISKIITGLRRFSRNSDLSEYCLSRFNEIIDEVLIMVNSKATNSFTSIKVECATDSHFLCNPLEIEQVLINLINNGIDAAKMAQEPWVQIKCFEENHAIVIQVRNSGPKISQQVQEKLFHPFFTTKIVGEGTGLGLSIVKGILDAHKASIALLTDDMYTCFEIRFQREINQKKAI